MSLTQWVFLRTTDGSFKSVAAATYSRFHSGEAPLTDSGRAEVIVAELTIEVDERVPVAAKNVTFRRFPLLATGLRDPHAAREERDLYEIVASGLYGAPSPESRFARLQVENRFKWSPSDADWNELAAAVNRRAKCVLLRQGLRLSASD